MLLLAFGLATLVSVLVIRTVLLLAKHEEVDPVADMTVDAQTIANHLAEAVRFQTISYEERERSSRAPFRGLHGYLARVFPKVHHTLSKEVVGDHSLLFTWQGRDDKLSPILFLAHQDVVPIEPGTEDLWTYPPFSGDIADGYIWGRGTLDDKVRILAMLEAVEMLLQEGYQPRRTLMFAFGQDEEVGGHKGAAKIAAILQARGLKFESVFDEGGAAITKGLLPGVSRPIALVGIAEKGYLNLELAVKGEGGHSSIPPPHTVVGILSSAIHRLEEQPFPARIEGATHKLAEALAQEMRFGQRVMLANLWLFGPLVRRELAGQPATNAAIRTTIAATMTQGGVKSNLLPMQARAVVNLRLLPGDTVKSTIARVDRIIDDPRVTISPLGHTSEPSIESSVESWGFVVLERSIRQIFGEVVVAPFLVPGATDSRHYAALTAGIYRFSPFLISPDDLRRIHGTNERISVENYVRAVKFYHHLIRNTDQ